VFLVVLVNRPVYGLLQRRLRHDYGHSHYPCRLFAKWMAQVSARQLRCVSEECS